jgi:tetratricopeptide (TPR) repeat protein
VGHLALPNPNLAVSSPKDTLRRLVGMSERSALDALSHVTSEPDSEIEGFRPLSESLEWRLAEAYWARAGVIPFVRNDVPYLVNNTGRLSDNSAALVLAALNELGPALGERVTLLELGAGTGLHARYFLDAFATRCHNEASALYDRLTYVVTDRFEGTVAGWQRDGLFAGHEDHVALRICDASAPRTMSLLGGERAPSLDAPMVVFCNYLLDVLPSTIARRARTGLEQLCVRTHVAGGVATLHAAGIASLEEARALAASGALADLTRLLPILSQLDLETAYRPWTPATRAEQTLVSAMTGPEGERGILNGGALACIDALLERTHESGFVLVNDYGPVKTEDVPAHVGVQRFGGSVALGLNFALIERVLVERGLTVLAPEGDEQRRVHTRLIGRRIGERARGVLRSRFAQETDRELDIPQEEARQHLAAGRRSDALTAYRQMIERNPGDWQMLGEAAEYVGLQLGDHSAGLDLARAALERNPWYSAWLWNVLGDCLFYKERLEDAHEAFLQAQRIDPDDPRTSLNLAYTLSARGDQTSALAAIARGLAHDGRGLYRPRLLEKQAQVLAVVSERASAEQSRLVRRSERFR